MRAGLISGSNMAAFKLLPYLLFPTTWIVLSLLLALVLLWRRALQQATAALLAALLLICTFANPLVGNWLWGSLERFYLPQPLASLPTADAIVLLGGGVELAAPPRIMAELNNSADRIWYAAELYHAGKAPLIVVSGGQVFPQPGLKSEADYHVDLLLRMGVPRAAIMLETASRNTAENALLTARLLRQKALAGTAPQRILLVTSAVHLPRSMLLFREAGLNPIAASCDVRVVELHGPLLLSLLPSARALSLSEGAIREWVGLFYYQSRYQLRTRL